MLREHNMAAVSDSLVALLKEHLEPLGHVTLKRRFSGAGVYCDGVIFGLILRDILHFKVDDGNRGAFVAEGMAPFSYEAKGRTVQMGAYWRVPERLLDEPEEMLVWARAALAAGRRAAKAASTERRKGRLRPQ
jgi:DNA transformation protein